MPTPPLRTEISDTYPLPSDATARVGFGKLWDYCTGLLGASGNAPEARAALGVAPRATRINIASAAGVVDLTTAAPNTDDICFTGSLAITGFTAPAGRVFRFSVATGAAPKLVNGAPIVTHAGGDIQLNEYSSGELRFTAADVCEVLSLSRPLIHGTKQATTSGTFKDFAIPAGAKRITAMLNSVSTNGLGFLLAQLSDTATIRTAGYVSSASHDATQNSSTAGFILDARADTAKSHTGIVAFVLQDAATNTWISTGSSNYNSSYNGTSSGVKSLGAALDTLRLTSTDGATFDAGSVNILVEF